MSIGMSVDTYLRISSGVKFSAVSQSGAYGWNWYNASVLIFYCCLLRVSNICFAQWFRHWKITGSCCSRFCVKTSQNQKIRCSAVAKKERDNSYCWEKSTRIKMPSFSYLAAYTLFNKLSLFSYFELDLFSTTSNTFSVIQIEIYATIFLNLKRLNIPQSQQQLI